MWFLVFICLHRVLVQYTGSSFFVAALWNVLVAAGEHLIAARGI